MKANRCIADFENKPLEDGMTASDEYFVELEADLLERLNLEEKLLGVETDGFQIEDLNLNPIEDQIDFGPGSKLRPSKIKILYNRYGQWAAVFLVLLGCLSIYQLANTDAEAYSSEEFTKELSEVYLQEQVYFLSDSDLELIINENDIKQAIEFSEEELEDYLLINEAYNLN